MPSITPVETQDILPWRDLYRAEMNVQIVHDSLHTRPGWTRSYLFHEGDAVIGYGAVLIGGPWTGEPTVFECYVLPAHRQHIFDLFEALLTASEAIAIRAQTNDTQLISLLHTFARSVTSEKILFADYCTTSFKPEAAVFRAIAPEDESRLATHSWSMGGDWIIACEGEIAGRGGLAFHYNRPYGDVFMEIETSFRRRGLGAYLVQELKRTCYAMGRIPAARCNPSNVASRKTLMKAGFLPCGHILMGSVRTGVVPKKPS